MANEKIFSGKTIDLALEKAASELSIDKHDLSYEVISLPKKGFLGIGAADAKIAIKSSLDEEDIAAVTAIMNKPKPQKEQKPSQQKPQGERQPRQQNQPNSRQNQSGAQQSQKEQPKPTAPTKPIAPPEPGTPKALALDFVNLLIKNMGINATAEIVSEKKDELNLTITGESLGLLIGHHGEILDSIQYLSNLAANKAEDSYLKVSIDIENYRSKREATLKALANRMAEKVLKYKKNITLEPMNSYERRIIHSVVQDIPGVTTYSVGVDNDRKIVVAIERPNRGGGNRSGKPPVKKVEFKPNTNKKEDFIKKDAE